MTNIFKKSILISSALLVYALPFTVSAHALPVSTNPESSAILEVVPDVAVLHFSEHIDESASSIVVTGPSGNLVSQGNARTDLHDTRALSVGLKGEENGTYIVAWTAVSADDGHFTKGAYPFAVGHGAVVEASNAHNDVEIVQLATTPEALSSALELMGHGFLWAALLVFAFVIRPLLITGKFDEETPLVRQGYSCLVFAGAAMAFFGGALQVYIKTAQLAGLRLIEFLPALWIYLGTDAGAATLWRTGAILVFFCLFICRKRIITAAKRFTLYEGALILTLCVFAFMRAKISHATSNPFHPDFSILMNFFHVIEKDIWAGITAILLLLVLSPSSKRLLFAMLPRTFKMLAIDFVAVSVTASYIVWLHLKSFENLFSTQWGAAFLELLLVAIFLVIARIYHVLARIYRPKFFSRALPATLAIEFACALLVVYCSSVVIITSPPLPDPGTKVFTVTDQGLAIELKKDRYEDGMLSLVTSGQGVSVPVVVIQDQGSGESFSIGLSERFPGGYVFPESLLFGSGPFVVSITVPHSDGYDAHALFRIQKGDFTPTESAAAQRSFDFFTIIMLLCALAVIVLFIPLYVLSGGTAPSEALPRRHIAEFSALATLLLALFLGTHLLSLFHNSSLENPFAHECASDGNAWHTMLPTMAGKPTSQTPAEGCMWGMGNYMYMFPDKREYDYYKSFGAADVELDTAPKNIMAGAPVALTVSLKNIDGAPATLFVDMEKLIHVVIISKDQSVFAHIHPDDIHPLTQKEIDSSTFTLNYTFPKSGDYLIAVDYAHGVVLESKQFTVHVGGAPQQSGSAKEYPSEGIFDGYHVALSYSLPLAGEVETFKYTITKNGQPVELIPYLSAAMHITAVKNDFSWYLHAHGEVHPSGTPLPPIIIKNGQVVHSMAMMMTPDRFALPVDAHMIFPSRGLYTLWGQFKTAEGEVVPTAFTIRVE